MPRPGGALMATIDIRRAHSLTIEEARKRAESIAREMQGKMGIRWRWEGDRIEFDAPGGAAKGVTGNVHVTPREIRVEAHLPFVLSLIKGSIQDKMSAILNASVI